MIHRLLDHDLSFPDSNNFFTHDLNNLVFGSQDDIRWGTNPDGEKDENSGGWGKAWRSIPRL